MQTESHRETLTVLVVDDISATRRQMTEQVNALGYHCIAAASGQDAMQCIDAQKPDIVLLDLLVPDLDGYAICQQARDRLTDLWLPVIVMSALEGEAHLIHALAMGAADYLVKPVCPAMLRAKLRHYQSVLALQAKAATLARIKDEFLATVSHELRTPLTSILGAMGLLAAGAAGALPPSALELTRIAQRNGERLSRLIDDVLDLGKFEGQRTALRLRDTSLNTLLQEAAEDISAYGERFGVTIAFTPAPGDARCMVDPDRLLQVTANLLSNAIKYSPKGREVTLSLTGNSSGWRIDVADQGAGLDPDFQKRMFEKYEQADGADRRRTGGTGLGLYISRTLIERMGGQISALSEPGKDAVFTVTLPAGEVHA